MISFFFWVSCLLPLVLKWWIVFVSPKWHNPPIVLDRAPYRSSLLKISLMRTWRPSSLIFKGWWWLVLSGYKHEVLSSWQPVVVVVVVVLLDKKGGAGAVVVVVVVDDAVPWCIFESCRDLCSFYVERERDRERIHMWVSMTNVCWGRKIKGEYITYQEHSLNDIHMKWF